MRLGHSWASEHWSRGFRAALQVVFRLALVVRGRRARCTVAVVGRLEERRKRSALAILVLFVVSIRREGCGRTHATRILVKGVATILRGCGDDRREMTLRCVGV